MALLGEIPYAIFFFFIQNIHTRITCGQIFIGGAVAG